MEQLFLKLLNMSITASWLVLAVVILRLLLKRAPKSIAVAMWGLVAIRLICPFSIESVWSLIPSAETVPADIVYSNAPAIQSGIPVLNSTVNPIISQAVTPAAQQGSNPLQTLVSIGAVVWLAGVAGMLLYTAISYLRIRRKVREAAPLEGNIWLCDHISAPFVLGIVRPRIYLPSTMEAKDTVYVIAHEKAHLKRRDHWWKPFGFLLLSVYWFNPVLWVAYSLLCRDIELACDEKVIRQMGVGSKKPYSDALINCSVPRRMIAACPLAFGEVGVKGRVKSVLNYKKPAFWIIIAAVVVCVALAAGFLTNPQRGVEDDLGVFIDGRIAEHYQSEESQGRACCVDWEVLGVDKNFKGTTVYMWVLYEEYSNENGLQEEAGAHIPTVITAKKENGHYKLVEYWEPRDGSYNVVDIKSKFPWYLHRKALDPQRYIESQQANCRKMAEEYFAEVRDESTRLLQLVDEIADNPDVAFSSNPYDYIKAKQALYDEILTYGESAVDCFTEQLRTTGENGLRGYIMAAACAEVTGVGEDKTTARWGNAQEWLALYETGGKEEFEDTLSNMEALAGLKEKYPQWFDLNTAKGVEVLVWQMAPNSYTCRLHSGKNLAYSLKDLLSVEGTTIEEMKWILSSYHVEREDVVIVPFQHPLSSYWYEIDEEYRANLEALFWGPMEEASTEADEWGLSMDLVFKSDTEFHIVFEHDSEKMSMEGTLTTSPEYEIRVAFNGATISFGDYMRNVLGMDYADLEFAWDCVLYTIEPDGNLQIEGDLQVTYGKLPAGTYVLCKPVNLTTDSGEVITRLYYAEFEIGD